MKKVVAVSISFSLLILIGCSTQLITPTQADVDRIKPTYPEYTLADLGRGKAMYEEKCSTCHALKNPTKRSADQWNHIVPEMSAMANKKETKISASDQELILKYLVTMCDAK